MSRKSYCGTPIHRQATEYKRFAAAGWAVRSRAEETRALFGRCVSLVALLLK